MQQLFSTCTPKDSPFCAVYKAFPALVTVDWSQSFYLFLRKAFFSIEPFHISLSLRAFGIKGEISVCHGSILLGLEVKVGNDLDHLRRH